MSNDGFARDVVMVIRRYYIISFVIVAVCVGGACFFAISRPDVYQSECTFSVKMNQPISKVGDTRLSEISKIAESDYVKKPIKVENNNGNHSTELLDEDYRGSNIRVQNLQTLNLFRLFAHGNTPEEAQRKCRGMYEHIAAFSEKNNCFEIDNLTSSSTLVEYTRKNYEKSKSAYKEYIDTYEDLNGATITTFDEKKERLYDNYICWFKLYQDVMLDELKTRWYNSWQVNIVDEASLPEKPIPKRTGFIICIGFIMGAFLCLLFGMIIVFKNEHKGG
ncbi:hypothetical protein [Anaerovibrio lipolyticus]|uniref:hypothetical protein n=1 Tax=Anaerovibrio lipolyticus TaxID=82374 RepID=UPI000487749F|nr:hypothetical protein [Anaerovibrio lipolyticus]